MSMAVEKALHDLGNGVYAYTQLPGSWGWSNAGLIVDGDHEAIPVKVFIDSNSRGISEQSLQIGFVFGSEILIPVLPPVTRMIFSVNIVTTCNSFRFCSWKRLATVLSASDDA